MSLSEIEETAAVETPLLHRVEPLGRWETSSTDGLRAEDGLDIVSAHRGWMLTREESCGHRRVDLSFTADPFEVDSGLYSKPARRHWREKNGSHSSVCALARAA